jgi:hypothetical protein
VFNLSIQEMSPEQGWSTKFSWLWRRFRHR